MVYRSVSQDTWDMGKKYLSNLEKMMGTREHPRTLNHKLLERSRGFFNHLSMTYGIMLPFLKGFHSTIDGWRDDRDDSGWKEECTMWKIDPISLPEHEGCD